jgi:superfamily I DNA and/or RNA helicase
VRAVDSDGNWIHAEGAMAARIVGNLIQERGVDPSEILVVSPFRDAKRPLERGLSTEYPDLASGTVHTAQGREADVVVLILGGNPNRPGVRSWAAERPNLFNVAVSRAKRRIYVIGDRDSWSKQRYFAQLAHTLPALEV